MSHFSPNHFEGMPYFIPDDIEVEHFKWFVMRDYWDDVVTYYKGNKFYHKVKVKGRGTAIHVAVSNGEKVAVKKLVSVIVDMWNNDDEIHPLRELDDDESRATPLHLAAYRGFTSMCECIIGKNGERKHLVYEENDNEETPLFWAVLGHRKRTFVYLYQFAQQNVNIVMDKYDTTILHVAIRREMFVLACIIMHCYASSSISSMKDKNGVTPLDVLATKTSTFKSGNQLSWWKEILLYCYPLKLTNGETILNSIQNSIQKIVNRDKDDQNGDTSIQLNYYEELDKEDKIRLCNRYRFVFRWPILSLLEIEKIENIKKKRFFGDQILKDLTQDLDYSAYMGGGGKAVFNEEHAEEIANVMKEYLQNTTEQSGPSEIKEENNERKLLVENIAIKETAYLVAAKHGIVEITSKLVSEMKSVIHERNSNKENVLLVAVKYRQPQIVEELRKNSSIDKNVFKSLCQQVDNSGNTMLHLASYTLNKETTWRISGPAMQMMWDIKWYKYIQRIVPGHFKYRINTNKQTPGEIFKEAHEGVLEKSTEWLKETAESCSVVAALIAGLSFATSGSVPGGNNDSGKPALEGQPAFEGFAISSLIGLYFSGTALIMFLSILTSRKQIEDFSINLPTKLLAGLTSLFVSIVAMFISFCAGHFFVLTDKYGKHDILFYLYIVFSFPVIFYAVVQLPLYIDLVKVIWKKVPPSSVKGVHL
ncbi:unnamed protein product [Trifolium pratense]|uniref:Uncharacterized protein n=1 Tax=Trifolium pratense TaxID=57577 RepID=A0ACB0J6J6_TRIPR|nr:unnamed protein product [Trifolium pratense]